MLEGYIYYPHRLREPFHVDVGESFNHIAVFFDNTEEFGEPLIPYLPGYLRLFDIRIEVSLSLLEDRSRFGYEYRFAFHPGKLDHHLIRLPEIRVGAPVHIFISRIPFLHISQGSTISFGLPYISYVADACRIKMIFDVFIGGDIRFGYIMIPVCTVEFIADTQKDGTGSKLLEPFTYYVQLPVIFAGCYVRFISHNGKPYGDH